MTYQSSKTLIDEWKKEDSQEIQEVRQFSDWLAHRIAARAMESDRGIINNLIGIKELNDKHLDDLQSRFIEKYY